MSNLEAVRAKVPTVELDGKSYTLRYDFNAWAEMEEHYGSMDAAMNALQSSQELNGKPATELRFFLWIGMHQDMEDLTLKEVGRMLTLDNLEKLGEAVMAAVSGSLGEASPAGE